MQRPKQRLKPAPLMDFQSKVQDIIHRVACTKHDKPTGQPCWWIPSDSGSPHVGICAKRIGKVYNGQIDPKSVRKSPKKENSR